MAETVHFKDNFSRQSVAYVKYRPLYPDELFQYLGSLTAAHELAWDCGTGNGQSANGLVPYYNKVYATDPSQQQISNALPHERITYKVEKAEQCALPDASVDIITIAQALHWFDFDKFYTTVKRVLKPGGVIAAWAYGIPEISPEIDPVIKQFHDETVGAFWQRENRLIEDEYATIPFPFKQISTPVFTMQKLFLPGDLPGLLESWSAVQRFIDQNGNDPVEMVKDELLQRWGNATDTKTATWKLVLKAGIHA